MMVVSTDPLDLSYSYVHLLAHFMLACFLDHVSYCHPHYFNMLYFSLFSQLYVLFSPTHFIVFHLCMFHLHLLS